MAKLNATDSHDVVNIRIQSVFSSQDPHFYLPNLESTRLLGVDSVKVGTVRGVGYASRFAIALLQLAIFG